MKRFHLNLEVHLEKQDLSVCVRESEIECVSLCLFVRVCVNV